MDYDVLEENVMIIIDNRWVKTQAILTKTKGGLQVHYTDDKGMILKREAYSDSKYGRQNKKNKND